MSWRAYRARLCTHRLLLGHAPSLRAELFDVRQVSNDTACGILYRRHRVANLKLVHEHD